MEGLGTKLKEARLARGLTLDEAGRLTKIRPGRLEEIENEDFSQFASLAYAKGFLLIYGKFLDVDVTPYMEAFETSEHVTTDGYAYLQADAPEPEPSRPVTIRRRSSNGGRRSLMPLVIGILVLVIGFILLKSILDVQRLKPRPAPAPGASPIASATVANTIVAPHAQPVEGTTPPAPADTPVAPTPSPTVLPSITPYVPPPPAPAEPEVRRAEPVNPQDAAEIPTPTPRPSPRRSPRRVSPTPQPVASPTVPVRPR
jgi:cytoskeleton protein RodZ